MTSPFRRGARRSTVAVTVAILCCAAAAAVADHAPAIALVNESPSLPRGLYLRRPATTPDIGAVVAVPQPVAGRPYLAGLGMPPEILLIKRVAAVGGDTVCREGDRVRTPRRTVLALTRDRHGAVLPRWDGCRVLATDELFLLGETAFSFDSRYFGPVSRTQIEGVYREVVGW